MTQADRPKRRYRGLLTAAIVVGILLVLLVVADRVGLVIAERTVADKAQIQMTNQGVTDSGKPHVTIRGFPFLTQVASGHYGQVDISVPNPSARGVRLNSLAVTATDVSASTGALLNGNGRIEAKKVVGTGQLSWASFDQLVDLSGVKRYGIDPKQIKIGSTDQGRISLSAPVKLRGQAFTVQATGAISVNRDILHVKVDNVTASDTPLPGAFQGVLHALASQLTFDVRIPELPYGLVLDRVRATSGGIAITASAADVILGG